MYTIRMLVWTWKSNVPSTTHATFSVAEAVQLLLRHFKALQQISPFLISLHYISQTDRIPRSRFPCTNDPLALTAKKAFICFIACHVMS